MDVDFLDNVDQGGQAQPPDKPAAPPAAASSAETPTPPPTAPLQAEPAPSASGPPMDSGGPAHSGPPVEQPALNIPAGGPVFVEQADHEQGFAEFFDRQIKPLLVGLETARLAAAAEVKRRKPIGYALIACFVIGGIWLDVASKAEGHLFIMIIVAALFILAFVQAPIFQFNQREKLAILPVAVRFFGDLNYVPAGGLSAEEVRRTLVVPIAPYAAPECAVIDTISGLRNGRNFWISRVKTGIGSGKHHRTLFDGDLLIAELPHESPNVTVVRTDLSADDIYYQGKKLEHIDLESPDFEKKFTAFGTDQVEARVMLTPDVMEDLTTLGSLPGLAGTRCSFVGARLCIALAGTRQLFPPSGVDVSAFDTADLHVFLARMHRLFAIMDLVQGKGRDLESAGDQT